MADVSVDKSDSCDALELDLVLKEGISVVVQGSVESEKAMATMADDVTIVGMDQGVSLFSSLMLRKAEENVGGCVGDSKLLKVRVVQSLAVFEGRAFTHFMENP